MAILTGLTSFTAGTPAVASQVNSNFTLVKNFVESITTGTNIDSGAITENKLGTGSVTETKIGVGAVTETKIGTGAVTSAKILDGTIQKTDLATALQQLLTPSGTISPFVGSAAPSGWALCDGATITNGQTLHPDLWAVLPAAYKSGSNIVLPNLKGRVVVGFDSAQTEFDGIGETGGEKAVTLTAAQSGLPSHSHTITDPGHFHTESDVTLGFDGQSGFTDYLIRSSSTDNTSTNTTGITGTNTNTATNASEAHTNLQPYIVFNYIIKL